MGEGGGGGRGISRPRGGRLITMFVCLLFKGGHGSGNKGNFESVHTKSKVCSYFLADRECTPLFITMDTSCKLDLKRDDIL